jgi:hypothetical protein
LTRVVLAANRSSGQLGTRWTKCCGWSGRSHRSGYAEDGNRAKHQAPLCVLAIACGIGLGSTFTR